MSTGTQTPQSEILLESGINEVEIIEFYLEDQSFGINVAKVRQLMQFEEKMLTRLPDSPPEILGSIMFRGNSITLIDLNCALKRKPLKEKPERQLVLITEFNERVTGFLIHGVNRIHRVSWTSLQPISYMPNKSFTTNFIGAITIDSTEILVLDLERLLTTIDPEAGFEDYKPPAEKQHPTNRENVKIVFSEDSSYIRELISNSLGKVGYSNIKIFKNGLEAFNYLKGLKASNSLADNLDLILTDIEMPQMDGLTLCKRFKEEITETVPVVIFSSLINEQMKLKCQEVRADAYLAKPQVAELIKAVDTFCHIG